MKRFFEGENRFHQWRSGHAQQWMSNILYLLLTGVPSQEKSYWPAMKRASRLMFQNLRHQVPGQLDVLEDKTFIAMPK